MHSISSRKIVIVFILFFLANIVFFLISHRFTLFENGVYFKYFQSMVNDLDFNIFNQFTHPYDRWMATANYNHPDYHSPFITSLLFVPYLFSLIFTLFQPEDLNNPLVSHHLFFTALLFIPVMIGGYLKKHSEIKSFREWFYFLIFSTGTLWYSFVEPSELSALCLIFTTILFFELFQMDEENNNWWIFSLALGFFSVLKPDGVFYLLAILPLFIMRKKWKELLFIFSIPLFYQAQILLINYIRFGGLLARSPILIFNHTYILDYLFGPSGLVTKTPVHFLILVLMLYHLSTAKEKRDKLIMGLGLLAVLFKAITVSFAITPIIDNLVNRHAIPELPFFAYALYLSFKDKKVLGRFLLGLFILFNIYDLYGCVVNLVDPKYYYYTERMLPLQMALAHTPDVLRFFKTNLDLFEQNLSLILFLSVQASLFMTFMYWLHLKYEHKFRYGFLISLLVLTTIFTAIDISNNKNHSRFMVRKHLYDQTVIVKGNAIYYDEVMDMIFHTKLVSFYYNKPDRQTIEDYQKNYLSDVEKNIIYDPTNFSTDLKAGKPRPSFWQIKDAHTTNILEKNSGI